MYNLLFLGRFSYASFFSESNLCSIVPLISLPFTKFQPRWKLNADHHVASPIGAGYFTSINEIPFCCISTSMKILIESNKTLWMARLKWDVAILRPIVKRARSDEEKAWHRPNQYPESLMSKRWKPYAKLWTFPVNW